MNPLKQHFRRPALSLKLPSGGRYYSPNSIDLPENGEVAIFPMTAIDELTSKTPDALYNGSAVVDIIRSCVPAIKNPWAMPSIDIDAVLIAIKTASSGNDLEIDSTCPACETNSKYGTNLSHLLNALKPEDFEKTITFGELNFKFKPLTFTDVNRGNMIQFEMQKEISRMMDIEDTTEQNKFSGIVMKRLADINFEMLADSIDGVILPDQVVTEKEYIIDYLKNCDKKIYEAIKNHVIKLKDSAKSKPLKVKCLNCSHDYEQAIVLNVTDFFD